MKEVRGCSREEGGNPKAIQEAPRGHYLAGGQRGLINVVGMNSSFGRKGRKNGVEVEMCSNDVTSLLQAPGVGDRRASRPPPAGGEACWRDRTWGGFAGDGPWFQTGCVRDAGWEGEGDRLLR